MVRADAAARDRRRRLPRAPGRRLAAPQGRARRRSGARRAPTAGSCLDSRHGARAVSSAGTGSTRSRRSSPAGAPAPLVDAAVPPPPARGPARDGARARARAVRVARRGTWATGRATCCSAASTARAATGPRSAWSGATLRAGVARAALSRARPSSRRSARAPAPLGRAARRRPGVAPRRSAETAVARARLGLGGSRPRCRAAIPRPTMMNSSRRRLREAERVVGEHARPRRRRSMPRRPANSQPYAVSSRSAAPGEQPDVAAEEPDPGEHAEPPGLEHDAEPLVVEVPVRLRSGSRCSGTRCPIPGRRTASSSASCKRRPEVGDPVARVAARGRGLLGDQPALREERRLERAERRRHREVHRDEERRHDPPVALQLARLEAEQDDGLDDRASSRRCGPPSRAPRCRSARSAAHQNRRCVPHAEVHAERKHRHERGAERERMLRGAVDAEAAAARLEVPRYAARTGNCSSGKTRCTWSKTLKPVLFSTSVKNATTAPPPTSALMNSVELGARPQGVPDHQHHQEEPGEERRAWNTMSMSMPRAWIVSRFSRDRRAHHDDEGDERRADARSDASAAPRAAPAATRARRRRSRRAGPDTARRRTAG